MLAQNVNPLLVPVTDAAVMIGISPKTSRNWLSTGKFPLPSFLIGGKRLVRVADIHKFVESLGAPPAADQPEPQKHRRGRPRKVKAE
ncbi:MAG: helix-turn-helix domain-containing protein [Pseudomonadota bacterium]